MAQAVEELRSPVAEQEGLGEGGGGEEEAGGDTEGTGGGSRDCQWPTEASGDRKMSGNSGAC